MEQSTQTALDNLETGAEELLKLSIMYTHMIKEAKTSLKKEYFKKKLRKNNELFAQIVQTSQVVKKVQNRRELEAKQQEASTNV